MLRRSALRLGPSLPRASPCRRTLRDLGKAQRAPTSTNHLEFEKFGAQITRRASMSNPVAFTGCWRLVLGVADISLVRLHGYREPGANGRRDLGCVVRLKKEAAATISSSRFRPGAVMNALLSLFGSNRFRLAVSADGSSFLGKLIVDQPRLLRGSRATPATTPVRRSGSSTLVCTTIAPSTPTANALRHRRHAY